MAPARGRGPDAADTGPALIWDENSDGTDGEGPWHREEQSLAGSLSSVNSVALSYPTLCGPHGLQRRPASLGFYQAEPEAGLGLGPEVRDGTRKGGAGPALALGGMVPMVSGGGTGRGLEPAVQTPRARAGLSAPPPPSRTTPAQPRSAQAAIHPRAISASGVHPLPPNAFNLQISSFKKSDEKKKKKSDGLCSRLWTLPNGLPRPLLLQLSFCPPHESETEK